MARPEFRKPEELPATSWTVLALLTFSDEMTGTDIKRLADWAVSFFYWSPSTSQVYLELKNLERYGYVESKEVAVHKQRSKRTYSLTPAGAEAIRLWLAHSNVEPYVMKHGSMLQVWMAGMTEPDRVRAIWQEHIDYIEGKLASAKLAARLDNDEPAWSFSQLALRWSVRHYQTELDLAKEFAVEIERSIRETADTPINDSRGLRRASSPERLAELAAVLSGEQPGPTRSSTVESQQDPEPSASRRDGAT
ncbi:PadR family transcriptional regulator [Gordonia sp. LSe1-13]|uniref:PadR family transcriptional regulator n=1 Tax=Gordonia sesuvii TaxID=3116777 RepID=A0ABU7M986_9ACTN|nr:PadR family transcriptional regulator [Gordonia sp. LSe1-13]